LSSAANEEKAKLQSAIETDRKKFEDTKEGCIIFVSLVECFHLMIFNL